MHDKFAYEANFILAAMLISVAERTRSIDHYRRFKAISFLTVKTIFARRHIDDRTECHFIFFFPETDWRAHASKPI